jgi:UDP-N-acetylglucosamine--N-acetylmuramyl-(pentapeptide) pyrophosphoryl-undecaprenol N-acetylglucosamine transferase
VTGSRPERAPAIRDTPGTTVVFAGGGTGGHLYPGLAIAHALARLDPTLRSFFIGAERGIERDVLPTSGFPYVLLDLHPLYRPRVWENWKTVRGGIRAWGALAGVTERLHPRLVLGTGGYASGLTLAYAATHRIPIVEQIADSQPGLTARAFARVARECYLGYPEAARILAPGRRTALIETGNPIDPPPIPRPEQAAARRAWGIPSSDGTVLLIVGGSQGARAINVIVDAWIARGLPDGLVLIWATGRRHYEEYAGREAANVRVRPYLSPIADAYAASDVVLARAGAMTTAELCAWGLPMILVPLPTAAADHQSANARALAAVGAAVHVPQGDLTVERLDQLGTDVIGVPEIRRRLAAAASSRGRPDAAENIARRILTLVSLTHFRS